MTQCIYAHDYAYNYVSEGPMSSLAEVEILGVFSMPRGWIRIVPLACWYVVVITNKTLKSATINTFSKIKT